MVNQFAAPPINPVISVQPLSTPDPGRDAAGVPAQIAGLPPGTNVEGFVINRDASNNPILRTPIGDILIQSDIFLKTGSEVVFRIDTTHASRARIITIDGFTPTDYAAQQTRAPQSDSIAQSALPPAPQEPTASVTGKPAAATAAQPLKAVLLAPPPPLPAPSLTAAAAGLPASESPLPAILTRLQTGATLKLTVLKTELPLPGVTPSAQHMPASSAQQPVTQQPAMQERVLAQPVMAGPLPAIANKAPVVPPINPSALAVAPAASGPVPPTIQTTGPSPMPTPAAPVPSPLTAQAMPVVPQPTAPASPNQPSQAAPPHLAPAPTVQVTQPPAALPAEQPSLPPAVAAHMDGTQEIAAVRMAANQPLVATPNQATPPSAALPAPATLPAPSASVTPRHVGATSTPAPAGLQAVIIGHEADGAAILHTPLGTLKTYTPRPLPVGTKLTMKVEPEQAPSAPIETPLSDTMEEITSLARDWKTPSTLLRALQEIDPQLARAFLQQMPMADARLSSGLLFFLAAVKNGDPRQWLGNRLMSQLEIKFPALAGRLREDMDQLQQMLTQAPKGGWSTVMLPVLYNGEMEHARLFYRQDEDKKSGGKGGSNHRFILEVDLSHLGDMQFDGFVRSVERKRQFDLVVRSDRPLSPEVSNDIRRIFDDAMQTTGYGGFLSFQQGSQHFVRPLAGMKETGSGHDTNTILA